MAAAALVFVLTACLIVAMFWPHLQRARLRRRIRRLPPPPVRVVKEPELKLRPQEDSERSPPAVAG